MKKSTSTNKIKRYNYKAKNSNNKVVTGYFDAENQNDVIAYLNGIECTVISITEDKLSTNLGLANVNDTRMSAKELTFFLTQLSTYIKSGIPLVDSMNILSKQSKNKSIQILFGRIVIGLNRGFPFSVCMEKAGKTFPKMLISMIKTAEMTGDLPTVLDDMAKHYKQQDANRKQIINAMIYPSVIMIFAVAVLTFVMLFIVPEFKGMYTSVGSELPKLTQVIVDISEFLKNNWIAIILCILGIIITLTVLYKKSTSAKKIMQVFTMHIPVVKDIIIYNQLVLFTSTFSTLVKHEIFITDTMDILNKITENEVYKGLIKKSIDNLSKGNGISPAFRGHWAFPDTAYQMLLTGEKTGKLGDMLAHVAEYYQEEETNIITRMKSLIEPVMIIILAVLVGIILIAVVYPMFGIYSEVM